MENTERCLRDALYAVLAQGVAAGISTSRLLHCLADEGSLSTAIRKAIERYVSSMGGWRTLPDTENALIRRELRKAKRMTSPEAEALAEVFALEEPAAPEPRVISLQVHYAETETVTQDFVDATGRVIARGTETRAKRP